MTDKAPGKIEKLREMAAVLRQQAVEATPPIYSEKMEQTARELDAEADRLERTPHQSAPTMH